MKRHPFRWDALIFGLVFLAVVGTWLTRTTGLLTSGQLTYALAAVLIAIGVTGILASVATPQKRPLSTPDEDTPVTVSAGGPAEGSTEGPTDER